MQIQQARNSPANSPVEGGEFRCQWAQAKQDNVLI
jgi:hypothetical protein